MARRHCSCGSTHLTGEKCPNRPRKSQPATARGYDYAWEKLRKQVVAEEGQCRACGHLGSPENPLTGDHIVALTNGGARLERGNVQCLCRWCNSSKRAS